jgi:hypothetical protein
MHLACIAFAQQKSKHFLTAQDLLTSCRHGSSEHQYRASILYLTVSAAQNIELTTNIDKNTILGFNSDIPFEISYYHKLLRRHSLPVLHSRQTKLQHGITLTLTLLHLLDATKLLQHANIPGHINKAKIRLPVAELGDQHVIQVQPELHHPSQSKSQSISTSL